MADQDYYGDHIVVERAENTYIQSLYKRGEDCQVEYRGGRPDHHFQTLTADRSLVPRLINAWVQYGPAADLLQAQHWHRLEF